MTKPPPKKAARRPTDPLVAFCRSLPGATEDIKWEHDLIFSVGGKMFAGAESHRLVAAKLPKKTRQALGLA